MICFLTGIFNIAYVQSGIYEALLNIGVIAYYTK